MPVFLSTSLVLIIVLFKAIKVSNRSDSAGYICGRTPIGKESSEYDTPCNFHARYVSLDGFFVDTTDLCEVEIYGEHTIDINLKTGFHVFNLWRILRMEMFIWYKYTIY